LYDDHDVWSLDSTLDGTGFILGGKSASPISGNKTEYSKGGFDYWAVKVNKQGNVVWNKTFGGSEDDNLYSIVETEKNKFLLGGTSFSGISGDKTGALRGVADYWIVTLKYRNITTIANSAFIQDSAIQASNAGFKIYPNPARDILHIQITGKAIVSLTDASGKIIFTKTIDKTDVLNVSSLSAGIYYLKNNITNETQKIMVVK